jgi:hypothetical protein
MGKEKAECERCWKEIIKKTAYHRYCVKCSNELNKERIKAKYREKKNLTLASR